MKSQFNNFSFNPFEKDVLNQLTNVREGETKVGEKIHVFGQQLEKTCKYVLLGISEDIGPQANGGNPGSTTAFRVFLTRFLNMQVNRFLSVDDVAVLGEIQSHVTFENIDQARNLVTELDDFVTNVLQPFTDRQCIPIVIGGGHNNAFPIIRALSTSIGDPIQVINFDPHADFRRLEGRHSGNPFSTAFQEGFLKFYAVMGLHQSYNSEYMLDRLEANSFLFSFFDDYLNGEADYTSDLATFKSRMEQAPFGIELDMDAIANMPSSAFTPSGFSVEQARSYILKMADSTNVRYLHLPESAPKSISEDAIVGKTLAYLVSDFIKSNRKAVQREI